MSREKQPYLFVLLAGFLLTVAAAFSYYAYFSQFPALRDIPLLNLPLSVIGLGLALLGMYRAWKRAGWRSKITGTFFGLLTMAAAGLFVFQLFVFSYQIPDASNAASLGQALPEYSAVDIDGRDVSPTGLAGKHALLVFYRGHW